MTKYTWNPENERNWDISNYPWVDSQGKKWLVSIEMKKVNGRITPVNFQLIAAKPGTELSHQTLLEVPIREITQTYIEREITYLEKKQKEADLAPHHGRAHTEEELKIVADIYLKAWEVKLPVQRAVANELNIPISTAVKRIIAARRLGLIPSTINRKK
jgi:hypothetical protein